MTITITIPDIPIIPALLGLVALANLALTWMTVAFVWGGVFNLIVPFVRQNTSGSFGPLMSIVMVGYIWYHIFWKTGRVEKRRSY